MSCVTLVRLVLITVVQLGMLLLTAERISPRSLGVFCPWLCARLHVQRDESIWCLHRNIARNALAFCRRAFPSMANCVREIGKVPLLLHPVREHTSVLSHQNTRRDDLIGRVELDTNLLPVAQDRDSPWC